MDEQWHLQAEQWLAGALSSGDALAFLERTRADPKRLAHLGSLLRQQALLAEHLVVVPAAIPVAGDPRRRWRSLGWSVAAAALVATVLGWWALPGEAIMARLAAAPGEQSQIERAGRLITTSDVISGDILHVGPNQAHLKFAGEATVITCAPGTDLRLDDQAHMRSITVSHGRIDALIAPQRADRPMIFVTTKAHVTVIGTQLTVIDEAGGTAVAVQHGSVQVSGSVPTEDLVVNAGQSAHVRAGQAPVAQPMTSGWEVDRGLIGYWPLDEGAGSVAHDVSGHGHDSRTLRAAWVAGRPGGTRSAVAFTGQFGGGWVDVGDQDLGTPEGITVSAWVKTSLPRYGTVFSGGFTVGSGASTIGIKESERPGADDAAGYVNFLAQQDHPGGRLDSPQRIHDGRWHHVAWTWSVDGWRHIWIDGVHAAGRQDSYERDRRWHTWHWAIGADSDRLVWNFAGAISEVRVYDRALPAEEIAILSGAGSSP